MWHKSCTLFVLHSVNAFRFEQPAYLLVLYEAILRFIRTHRLTVSQPDNRYNQRTMRTIMKLMTEAIFPTEFHNGNRNWNTARRRSEFQSTNYCKSSIQLTAPDAQITTTQIQFEEWKCISLFYGSTEVIKARGDDVAPRCRSGLVKFELVPQGVWVFFIFRHFDHIKYRQRQGEWNNNTRDWLEFC